MRNKMGANTVSFILMATVLTVCLPSLRTNREGMGHPPWDDASGIKPAGGLATRPSAHGQRVPDSNFEHVAHPFGQAIAIDVLAEAATFIIRKTVTEILKHGWREKFKDVKARECFWLYEFGLDKKQSVKRLAAEGLL